MITNLELFERMKLFEWLLKKKYFIDTQGKSITSDVTRGQGRILAYLSKYPEGLSTKKLSNKLGVRTSSLNETLAKLEHHGFITREPSENDRRVIINQITSTGLEMVPTEFDFTFFDCLEEDERVIFSNSLEKITQELFNYLQEKGEANFEECCKERFEAMVANFGTSDNILNPFPMIEEVKK